MWIICSTFVSPPQAWQMLTFLIRFANITPPLVSVICRIVNQIWIIGWSPNCKGKLKFFSLMYSSLINFKSQCSSFLLINSSSNTGFTPVAFFSPHWPGFSTSFEVYRVPPPIPLTYMSHACPRSKIVYWDMGHPLFFLPAGLYLNNRFGHRSLNSIYHGVLPFHLDSDVFIFYRPSL